MMKKTPASLLTLVLLAGAPLLASAKLPPPNPTPEAKAKAAEATAKTAWTGKVDAYKLCMAQDKVVNKYRASASAAGKQAPAAIATPACADPGPFAYVPPEAAKPLEAAGAHSPSSTSSSPPNSAQPAAAAPKQQ